MNNLAICQQRLGHAHEALALYRDLAVLNPELGQVQNNLGQVLQGLGRHEEAEAAFRRALELAQRLDERIDNVAPFLMQSLVEYGHALPSSSKIKGDEVKHALRIASEKWLPAKNSKREPSRTHWRQQAGNYKWKRGPLRDATFRGHRG